MHNAQYYSVLNNKAVRQVICEGSHFTHMWKKFTLSHHFTKRAVWVHKTSLTPARLIEVSVPSQERGRSCICVLGINFCYWILGQCYLCVSFYFVDMQTIIVQCNSMPP